MCLLMMANSLEEAKCHELFLMEARTLMMMTKTASVMWVNYVLKRCDAVLSKIFSNLMLKNKMELLSSTLILKAVEESTWVLYDEDMRKAVSF